MKSISLAALFTVLLVNCKNKVTQESVVGNTRSVDITQVVGVGRIEPEIGIVQLSSESAGIVQKVYKIENDSVQAGDIIVGLKHTVEDASIAQLKTAAAAQEAQIKVDQDAIDESQIRYNNSNIELQRLEDLLLKGAETRQVVDGARTDMRSFQANIKKLQATVKVSQVRWKETNAQVAVAEAQLQQKFVRAPVNGILLELNTQAGNSVDSKQVIAQLKPEGRTIAVCEIDELFADKVKAGQSAIIRNFGALDTISTGTVYFVSAFLKKKSLFTEQAGETQDRRVREIKIGLDNTTNLLLNARIECVVFVSKSIQ
ncbi:MAG: HlyD family efflux transporter periplasmic adaptor subunit [Chitinophagaceae bacterium]